MNSNVCHHHHHHHRHHHLHHIANMALSHLLTRYGLIRLEVRFNGLPALVSFACWSVVFVFSLIYYGAINV
jgi:hypothetical protein